MLGIRHRIWNVFHLSRVKEREEEERREKKKDTYRELWRLQLSSQVVPGFRRRDSGSQIFFIRFASWISERRILRCATPRHGNSALESLPRTDWANCSLNVGCGKPNSNLRSHEMPAGEPFRTNQPAKSNKKRKNTIPQCSILLRPQPTPQLHSPPSTHANQNMT